MDGYASYYHEKEFPCIAFADDYWDFSVLNTTMSRPHRGTPCDFAKITNPRWRLSAKETCLALLHPQHYLVDVIPRRRDRPLPLKSVAALMNSLHHWFEWLEGQGVESLEEVAQEHCDAYLAVRRSQVSATTAHSTVVIPIRELAVYRDVLTETYSPGFTPWRKRKAKHIVGIPPRGDGNKTPWIPDQVLDPLLAGALFYVQVAAADIVAAQEEHRALPPSPPSADKTQRQAMLAEYLEVLRAEGRALPARDPRQRTKSSSSLGSKQGSKPNGNPNSKPSSKPNGLLPAKLPSELKDVNFWLLGRLAGVRLLWGKATAEEATMLVAAARELGVKPGGFRAKPCDVARDDGTEGPWRDDFGPITIRDELLRLLTACFVVVASLTGLRPSEVLDLRKGCVEVIETGDEQVRYRVNGRVYKQRGYGGEEEKWTVIKPVVEAIRVLETAVPGKEGALLFNSTIHSTSDHGAAKERKPNFEELLSSFQIWQNSAGGRRAGLPPIPDVEGKLWHYAPSQFRRTLARQLAFRPHGTIASKVHLKHVSAAITEGYWGARGESAERFLAEVGEQEQEARKQRVLLRYYDWEAGVVSGAASGKVALSGGGSRKLVQDFAAAAQQLEGFKGTVEQRDKRILELLRAQTNTLHIGLINDCHFSDPSKARCLKSRGVNPDGATVPIISACDPSRCANSVIGEEHAQRWGQSLVQIDNLLAGRKLPGRERERLAEEKTRLENIVAPFKTTSIKSAPVKGAPSNTSPVETVTAKAITAEVVAAKTASAKTVPVKAGKGYDK